MLCDVLKIRVSREQYELVSDTQLSNQSINRTGLNPAPAAFVSQLCCGVMIFSVRRQERKGTEVFDDLKSDLGTGEPLEQFLKYQPGRENPVPSLNCANECRDLRKVARLVPAQEQ